MFETLLKMAHKMRSKPFDLTKIEDRMANYRKPVTVTSETKKETATSIVPITTPVAPRSEAGMEE